MAKKDKKKSPNQQLLSPINYIYSKARNLPIVECLITANWKEVGICNIIVARKHTNENYTFGIYLVDLYCLGVKEALWEFNVSSERYEEIKESHLNKLELITYDEVHNLIYGAAAYAEDLGFSPHKDFAVAQYILEEDTEDIPLIEYEFGYEGKPLLIVNSEKERDKYLPMLQKSTGGDCEFMIMEDEDEEDEYEYEDEDEYEENEEFTKAINKFYQSLSKEEKKKCIKRAEDLQKRLEKSQSLPHAVYNYQYPDYPQTLELTHTELNALFLPENNDKLEKPLIDMLLSLPRESLIKDLNNCILYETGQNCREISDKNYNDNIYGSLAHALLLLAELEAEESLQVALEVLRQNKKFSSFFFGDFAGDILPPVFYRLGKNQLPVLLSFAKEPHILALSKYIVSPAVATIFYHAPERRAEIIDWYGELLDFYYEKINDTAYYDANFIGMLMFELLDICAKELLPKIKKLYDTGLVDEMSVGTYETIVEEMNEDVVKNEDHYKLMSIYDFYKEK